MCLLLVAVDVDSDCSLIVAGNRDEFHARPTQNAAWWADAPDILGGRDLQAGGTWLAIHRSGRFATVTNYRDADAPSAQWRSRGKLVIDFLQGDSSAMDYLQSVDGSNYAGFNLVVADGTSVAYMSNRGGGIRQLPCGVYGLSNATLDTPWEKVERSKARLQCLLDDDAANETELLRLLDDRDKGPVTEVKSDRLPFAVAHAITAPFIVLPEYGTRCSTVVRMNRTGQWSFLERRFDAAGKQVGESRYSFSRAID